MCEICHRTPCHPRCPNADEPAVVCLCANCGDEIHEGDEVYNINDELWCENCVRDCHCTAEYTGFNCYDEYDE